MSFPTLIIHAPKDVPVIAWIPEISEWLIVEWNDIKGQWIITDSWSDVKGAEGHPTHYIAVEQMTAYEAGQITMSTDNAS